MAYPGADETPQIIFKNFPREHFNAIQPWKIHKQPVAS